MSIGSTLRKMIFGSSADEGEEDEGGEEEEQKVFDPDVELRTLEKEREISETVCRSVDMMKLTNGEVLFVEYDDHLNGTYKSGTKIRGTTSMHNKYPGYELQHDQVGEVNMDNVFTRKTLGTYEVEFTRDARIKVQYRAFSNDEMPDEVKEGIGTVGLSDNLSDWRIDNSRIRDCISGYTSNESLRYEGYGEGSDPDTDEWVFDKTRKIDTWLSDTEIDANGSLSDVVTDTVAPASDNVTIMGASGNIVVPEADLGESDVQQLVSGANHDE